MNKLVYILWSTKKLDPAALRVTLLERCAPKLLARGASCLHINIADDRVGVASPAPETPFSDEPFVAQVNVWLDESRDRHALEDVLRAEGFELAGYRVDETLYTEYGENAHGTRRDWPDGERSPYVVAVTLLERPRSMPKDAWMRHWYGRQSPMSEAMQPRARYVRNVVREVLTEGAFPYEGIVEESWPSADHIKDPFRFYGAGNALQLARNMGIMMKSVTAFLPIHRIPNVMTSEYFVRTPFAAEGISTPADRRSRR
jgi:hypothetical protein